MVGKKVEELFREAVRRACGEQCVGTVEHTPDSAHGEYASSVALGCAKRAGLTPRRCAEQIVEALEKPAWVDRYEVAGPGFINVFLARTLFRDTLVEALGAGERWGAHGALAGERVMVEYTQPNPFKPFHIGHLMSNTIGESLARLYEFSGAEVRRANYQGDVGRHVAMCLWGLARTGGDPSSVADLGKAYVEGNRAFEASPDVQREIVAYNKMVYEHAPEVAEAYAKGRAASLAHFEELYRVLGTRFDHYFFESESQVPGRAMVKEGLAQGVFVESDGALVFRGEERGLHTRVFLTAEGLPTYEAKELGLAELKEEKWPFDRSITVTASEQDEYFKVVYTALGELRPALVGKLLHVPHGMMVLTTGKMSSRKGNVVTGESLIADMLTLAREKVADRDLPADEKEAIAEAVAVAAIKYSVLKQRVGKNITFDPTAALSFEGDSGPYLQYAHTRAVSLLAKARTAGFAPATSLAPHGVSPVERLFHRFPEVVVRAREAHEPHHVTTYLVELAAAWNSWYAAEKVLDGSPTVPYKLAVVDAFRLTMRNGLFLLGMRAPERM